jgi:hypothetical protein
VVNGISYPFGVLPRSLDEEIVDELAQARRALAYDETRVQALESLLEVVRSLSARLRRTATIEDVLSAPGPAVEHAHHRQLVSALRSVSRDR